MSIRPWRLPLLLLCALSLAAPVAGGLLLLLLEGLAKGHVSLLLAQPGLWHSLGLSLWVAGASTLGALFFTALLLARGEGGPGCAGCAACSPPPAGPAPRRLRHRRGLPARPLRLVVAPDLPRPHRL